MAYVAREVKDRIATGDDCFYLVTLADGRCRLVPAPDSVTEAGTIIGHGFLQLIEDRVVWLMNTIFDDIRSNPFEINFDTLDGVMVEGIWNDSLKRIEC